MKDKVKAKLAVASVRQPFRVRADQRHAVAQLRPVRREDPLCDLCTYHALRSCITRGSQVRVTRLTNRWSEPLTRHGESSIGFNLMKQFWQLATVYPPRRVSGRSACFR